MRDTDDHAKGPRRRAASLPRGRACRRRGQAHALRPAESAARDRRALHARPCARRRAQGGRRRACRRGRAGARRCRRRGSSSRRRTPRFSSRPSGSAPPMRCWRRARLLPQGFDDILVVFADTPLVRPETFSHLRRKLTAGAGVVALGFAPTDPTGYGRLLTDADGALLAIREHKDASPEELRGRRLQRRADGARRRQRARLAGADRQRQCPEANITCPTRWRSRGGEGAACAHRHGAGGGSAGRQRPRPARRRRSRNPEPAAPRRHAERARPWSRRRRCSFQP